VQLNRAYHSTYMFDINPRNTCVDDYGYTELTGVPKNAEGYDAVYNPCKQIGSIIAAPTARSGVATKAFTLSPRREHHRINFPSAALSSRADLCQLMQNAICATNV
jgi:hypothetical protein